MLFLTTCGTLGQVSRYRTVLSLVFNPKLLSWGFISEPPVPVTCTTASRTPTFAEGVGRSSSLVIWRVTALA